MKYLIVLLLVSFSPLFAKKNTGQHLSPEEQVQVIFAKMALESIADAQEKRFKKLSGLTFAELLPRNKELENSKLKTRNFPKFIRKGQKFRANLGRVYVETSPMGYVNKFIVVSGHKFYINPRENRHQFNVRFVKFLNDKNIIKSNFSFINLFINSAHAEVITVEPGNLKKLLMLVVEAYTDIFYAHSDIAKGSYSPIKVKKSLQVGVVATLQVCIRERNLNENGNPVNSKIPSLFQKLAALLNSDGEITNTELIKVLTRPAYAKTIGGMPDISDEKNCRENVGRLIYFPGEHFSEKERHDSINLIASTNKKKEDASVICEVLKSLKECLINLSDFDKARVADPRSESSMGLGGDALKPNSGKKTITP